MIVSAHQYFLNVRQHQQQHQGITLCKQVASVLNIGDATVAQVVAEWNQNKKFVEYKKLSRPKNELDPNIAEVIHDLISPPNTSVTPLSTAVLWQN